MKVLLETTHGDIVLELYDRHAPNTCQYFVELVMEQLYDGAKFLRIIPNSLVHASPRLGASEAPQPELSQELRHTGAGVVSMVAKEPHGQFFITLAPAPKLDGKHSIFGRVWSGLDTLVRMSQVPIHPDNRPIDEVSIEQATVIEEDDQSELQ